MSQPPGTRRRRLAPALLAPALAPAVAGAHSFGTVYNLPVPIWMYLYGAVAALVLSFGLVGYFVTAGRVGANFRARVLGDSAFWRAVTSPAARATLRALGLGGLAATVLTGLAGLDDAYQNFSMTFFWIVFLLGFTYLTALLGDLYAVANPWRTLTDGLERLRPGLFAGQRAYPARWHCYPALALYMAFVWSELFGRTTPRSLALGLLGYSGLTLAAAWWFGRAAWFKYGEFFGVFFRLVAKVSPFAPATVGGRPGLRLRQPFMGLVEERAGHASELLFVLFMLSSTAFDGLKETAPWVALYWRDAFRLLVTHLGGDMMSAYPVLEEGYLAWQTLVLLSSAWLYLGLYLGFVWLARVITGTARSVRDLSLDFAYTLVPIALVYNVTHYYTLIETQGSQIFRLASDPLGRGWDLFGTRRWLTAPLLPDAGWVWHTQVWLILFGHIVGVYLAHVQALKVFPDRRRAAVSQLPMLLLMVLFTTFGLWILAQPISTGQVMSAP